jgi:NAD(P)H-binding
MNRILITGATGRAGRQVVSQLLAMGVRVRALARNPDVAGLPPQVEVVRGDLTLPETLDECLWHRYGVLGVVRFGCLRSSGHGAHRETHPTHRVPFISVPDRTPIVPGCSAKPNIVAACGNRTVDQGIGAGLDVLAAWHVRSECPVVVGAADPRRRRRALALCPRSYSAHPRA